MVKAALKGKPHKRKRGRDDCASVLVVAGEGKQLWVGCLHGSLRSILEGGWKVCLFSQVQLLCPRLSPPPEVPQKSSGSCQQTWCSRKLPSSWSQKPPWELQMLPPSHSYWGDCLRCMQRALPVILHASSSPASRNFQLRASLGWLWESGWLAWQQVLAPSSVRVLESFLNGCSKTA